MFRTLDVSILPRTLQISSVLQEIDWNLDAGLSAAQAQRGEVQIDSAPTTRNSMISSENISIGGVEEENNNNSSSELEAETTLSKRRNSISSAESRSKLPSKIEISNENVEILKRRLENFTPRLRKILEKVQRVCDYAVEDQTMIGSATSALRRAIGDCFIARNQSSEPVVESMQSMNSIDVDPNANSNTNTRRKERKQYTSVPSTG